MPPFDAAQELRLVAALYEYYNTDKPNRVKICAKHVVKYKALRDRIAGHKAGNTRGGTQTRLTVIEDLGLKKYIAFLYRINMPAGKIDVTKAVNLILEARGAPQVSKEWGRR
jgi:transketolase C-terminal domain/subunit